MVFKKSLTDPNKPTARKLFSQWAFYFFLFTTLILVGIELWFLKYQPNFNQVYGTTPCQIVLTFCYLAASYVTQASLLALSTMLLALFVGYLYPKPWLYMSLSVTLSALLISAQIIDTFTFNLYHAHEILVGFEVFKTGATKQVIPLSSREIELLVTVFSVVLGSQSTLAWFVLRQIHKKKRRRLRPIIAFTLIGCFLFSYLFTASVVTFPPNYQITGPLSLLILKAAQLVPYYNEVYSLLLPTGSLPHQRTLQIHHQLLRYQTSQPTGKMHYPLHKLRCSPLKKPLNIVWIVLDTWRFDSMNPLVTPNIYQFSKETLQFQNHWSGGNCTQSGLFTLFYGIPANYWKATILGKKEPVLLKELKKQHYELEIDASATLTFPAFNKNVFLNVPNLKTQTKGSTTLFRDQQITNRFIHFLQSRSSIRPFFGFIFYDSAHNYCDGGPQSLQAPFQPAIRECARFALTPRSNRIPYLNRYHNALYFLDQEVEKILQAMKQLNLFENTLIVITADHGEEFNDEKTGLWSHNSAYSAWQLHVPLLIYWPGKKPQTVNRLSTHFDLVPTLLSNVLACSNPLSDYSNGYSLFDAVRIPFMVVGNYTNYAVLTQDRITYFYPNGNYSIQDRRGKEIPFAQIEASSIQQVNEVLSRYLYKRAS